LTEEIPLVSVCMITYNHDKFIAKAIEGVIMQQTNFPIELVIGEDKGTDSTYEICCEYEAKYPNIIRVLKRDKNLGMITNFIDTFQNCRGKYVALCEGDDYWTYPLKLQKQKEHLEANNLVMNFHQGRWVNPEGELTGPQCRLVLKKWDFETLLTVWPLTASIFFEKNASLPLPEIFHTTYSGDQIQMLIIASKGNIGFIDEYWCNHVVLETGVTATTNSAAWILNRIQSLKGLVKYNEDKKRKLLMTAVSKLHFHFAIAQTKKTSEKCLHILKGIISNREWTWSRIRLMLYEIRKSLASS
jgi:glycosyltransferase involved in cell wall biosynthesis